MTEADLQRYIQDYVKQQGGDSYKVVGSSTQRSGEPDLDGWIPSDVGAIPFKIEVKSPIGKPTLLQVVRLRRYHQSGAYLVGICVTVSDFQKLVDAYRLSIIELRDMWGAMQELGIDDPYYIYHKQQIGEPDPVYRKD